MTDIFAAYARTLKELLKQLGKDHPRYTEALSLQSRLLENTAQTRRYGDTEIRRAERAQVVDELNHLAQQTLGTSFNQFRDAHATPTSTLRLPPRVVHPLVPAPNFQSRPQLSVLHEFWRGENEQGVIALVGLGGVGKTAIIHEFVTEVSGDQCSSKPSRQTAPLPRPDAAFVWSFYYAPHVDEFLTELLSYLTSQEYNPENRRATVFQVLETLESLSGNRILLVLDGLERLQQDRFSSDATVGAMRDPHLKQLLRRIAEGIPGVRLVVSSRLPLSDLLSWSGGGYRAVEVDELPPSAAIALLRANGVMGEDELLEGLAAEFGYHALSLELLGNLLREFHEGDPVGARQLSSLAGVEGSIEVDVHAKRLVRLLRFYEENLALPGALILQCLSVFRMPVSIELFSKIFQEWVEESQAVATDYVGGRRLEQYVRRLSSLYLASIRKGPQRSQSLTLHPAIRQYFRLRVADVEALHELVRAGLASEFAMEAGVVNPETLDSFEEYLYHTAKAGQLEEAVTAFHESAGYHYLGWRLGAYSRGESISRMLASSMGTAFPPSDRATDYQATLVNQRGKFLFSLGDLEPATKCLEYNVLVHKQREDSFMTCRGLQNLCIAYVIRGHLTQALVAAEEACALAPELGYEEEQWDAFACRGIARSLRGDVRDALHDFRRANVADTSSRSDRDALHGQKMVNYCKLLVRLGKLALAEAVLRQVISLYTRSNWPPDARRCELVLAHVLHLKEDSSEASSLVRRAVRWGVESADQEVLAWGHLMQTHLAADAGDLAGALRSSHSGLRIARQCGYGLHWIDLMVVLGQTYLDLNRPSLAKECADSALEGIQGVNNHPELLGASRSECRYAWGKGDALHLLGRSLLALGSFKRALQAFRSAFQVRTRISDPEKVASELQVRRLESSDSLC